jgi:hypothetical protein
MEENAPDFLLDLLFRPIRMEHAQASGFQLARGPIKFERCFKFLFGGHAPKNLKVFWAVIFVRHRLRLLCFNLSRESGNMGDSAAFVPKKILRTPPPFIAAHFGVK